MLGPVAVEIAFPLFGIMPPLESEKSKEAVESLEFGLDVFKRGPVSFVSGSTAEGLAMEGLCGHGETDFDKMEVFSKAWRVFIRNPAGHMCHLVFDDSSSTSAYGRVKVTNEYGVEELLCHMEEDACETVGKGKINRCMVEQGGQMWLSSRETVWALQGAVWNDYIE